MPWFKLDDGFDSHPKVLAAGNEAVGLFVRCGTYSARALTDGFVPDGLARMYGPLKVLRQLVVVDLLEVADDHPLGPGWLIHDYLDYNPSREQVLADRRRAADRQARRRSKGSNTETGTVTTPVSHGVTHARSHTTPTRPDPTRAAAAADGAAAAAELDPILAVLRSKLQQHTPLRALRFDTLTADQIARLVALVERQGDARLVAAALKTCRDPAPVHVAAFLGTWEALPPPGKRLHAVPDEPPPVNRGQASPETVAAARATALGRRGQGDPC